jgi:polyhydroxyalkanoate synthesis regulator phasin
MDRKKVFRQMVEFQKGAFDNSFDAFARLQEQGEAMVDAFVARAAWIPEEGRKAVADWLGSCRKARADFKDAVDANFERVEDFFDSEKIDIQS